MRYDSFFTEDLASSTEYRLLKRQMLHASTHRINSTLTPRSKLPRWEIVGDEHIDAIQTVEQSFEKPTFSYVQCVLCRPHVGDALGSRYEVSYHLHQW